MRGTSTPVKRKNGMTTISPAPRSRQRSSAPATSGWAIETNAGSTIPRPRPSERRRATLQRSALASGALDPRPTRTDGASGGPAPPPPPADEDDGDLGRLALPDRLADALLGHLEHRRVDAEVAAHAKARAGVARP